MPPVKYAPGAKSRGTPSEYTDAQWKALKATFQLEPKLKLNAARAEFVNHVMLPDGTITDDLATVRAATEQHDAADTAALNAFLAEHQDAILRGTLPGELQVPLAQLRQWGNHDQLRELNEHALQNRFLFIVDENLVARIYFQCAVPGNPDVQLADSEPTSTEG